MAYQLPILDLWIQDVRPLVDGAQSRWVGLRDTDHLLRRFGAAEVLRLTPAPAPSLRLRPVADEVWTLLEGEVVFRWLDLRPGSPSHGRQIDHRADSPTQVLAPFGVAFGVRPLGGPALLLRVSSHADDDPDGGQSQLLPWGDSR